MDTKKILVGTIAAFIVSYILGAAIYGYILADYMGENASQISEVNLLTIALGHITLSFLLSFIMVFWARISTFMTGLKAGALIGGLMTLGIGLTLLGTSSLFSSATPLLVDTIAGTVLWGLAGGVAGWAIGKFGES